MIHFVYSYSEHKAKNDCSILKTVKLYRIKKNKPHYIGRARDHYVSEFQLVTMCAQAFKALPETALKSNPNTGGFLYSSASEFENNGIATFTRI